MKKDKPVKAEEVRAKIKRLVQQTLQEALEGELEEFVGYPKHQINTSDNSRNGHSLKTVQTDSGPMEIEVPRTSPQILSLLQPFIEKFKKTLQ